MDFDDEVTIFPFVVFFRHDSDADFDDAVLVKLITDDIVCVYIYDDAFYERVVVRVVVDGVAVVAKEYSREDGDFIVVEIIVRCEETR